MSIMSLASGEHLTTSLSTDGADPNTGFYGLSGENYINGPDYPVGNLDPSLNSISLLPDDVEEMDLEYQKALLVQAEKVGALPTKSQTTVETISLRSAA